MQIENQTSILQYKLNIYIAVGAFSPTKHWDTRVVCMFSSSWNFCNKLLLNAKDDTITLLLSRYLQNWNYHPAKSWGKQ